MTSICPCCLQPVATDKVLIDYGSNQVAHNGVTIYATRNQIDLLGLLLVRSPRVATHDDIIKAIWGDNDPLTADKAIQVMISQIRKKLMPETGLRIETVYRRGYRLVKTDAGRGGSIRKRKISGNGRLSHEQRHPAEPETAPPS